MLRPSNKEKKKDSDQKTPCTYNFSDTIAKPGHCSIVNIVSIIMDTEVWLFFTFLPPFHYLQTFSLFPSNRVKYRSWLYFPSETTTNSAQMEFMSSSVELEKQAYML